MSKQSIKFDPNQIVEFYNPYPVSLDSECERKSSYFPKQVREIIKQLNGKRFSLVEVLKRIQAVTRGRVAIIPDQQCIILGIKISNNRYCSYRLIKYKHI